MMDDDDYDIEVPLYEEPPLDPVAARAEAFFRGVALVDKIKDEDLRKESLMMLAAIRRSFKTLPAGELSPLPGGKA